MADQVSFKDTEIEIVDNLTGAPTIYADGVQGMFGVENVTRINLFQLVQELGEHKEIVVKKVVVARLAMPANAMLALAKWIQDNIKEKEDDG